ncbi:MAG: tetratricopeptide repeat protein [Bacteroidetes bacterium]|nr:tetratricopeptide repeat protein [Bacteroidota bacterium]
MASSFIKGYIVVSLIAALLGCDYKYSNHEIPALPAANTLNYIKSIRVLDEAIRRDPQDAANYHKRALLLYKSNSPGSLQSILKAIELDQNHAQYYFLAAQILLAQQQIQNGLDHALRAEILGYRFPDLYQLLAELNYHSGYYGKGLLYVNRALALNPSESHNYYLKGLMFIAIGDTLEGEKYIRQSLDQQESRRAFNAMVDIYSYRKQFDSAFYFLNRNLSQDPQNPALLYKRAILLKETGDLDSAEASFKALVDSYDPKYQLYNQISFIKYTNNQWDSADYYAIKTLSVNNEDMEALLILARTQNRRGNYSQSIVNYTTLLEVDSTVLMAQEELEKLKRKVAYLRDLQKQMLERPKIEILVPKKVVKEK